MKKKFIFFAALAVFLAIAVTPANAAKPLKIVKGPYLQQLTPDSIVIMWETNTAADSRVDYWITPEEPYYVEDPTAVKIHEVEISPLTGASLEPDTTYNYTVKSGKVTSAESTFATAPAAPRSFRFVAYGDTRTNKNDHAAVIQAIIASEPELVLHTGDLVSDGDNKNVWGNEFFTPAYPLMINTPLLPIIGNHEGSGNLFRDFFSLGDNDDWFAFTYGGVRFIGLNTHNRSYSPGSDQYDWLVSELGSDECTSADWQIVYFHHPPYTATSSHSDDTNVQTHLVPLFEQYGVDMVFNGHSHAYERYFNNGIYYIVTGGGGAPLASLVDDTVVEPIREFGESVYHHCVINVTAESLTLSARYNNGQEFDTITLPPVDVTPPTASLIEPLDNGPDDLDADDGEVTVNTTQPVFDIQLSDVGDGINDGTVISGTVAITKDDVPLTEPTDYTFSYDEVLDVITLAPTGIDPFGNGLYVITLSGIADIAGNEMEATNLTILIDTSIVPPETLSFQQGVDGYTSMVDTMIRGANPNTNYADSASEYLTNEQYQYDCDLESGGSPSHVLLRFDNIIGPGQIPAGSTITSGILRIRSIDDGQGGKLHRILQPWVDTDVTWNNSFDGDGIQADNTEAASALDDNLAENFPDTDVALDVTATVQDWADGATTNNGWAILPNGTNGWRIAAAEHPTADWRPELIVEFITIENEPPVAVDDGPYSVDEDDTLTVPTSGVLANDSDPDPEDTLTAVLVSDVGNGTLTLNPDGSFTYTPDPDFSGTDTFTYRANDGIWNSNVATVTITVDPINDGPVITSTPVTTATEDVLYSYDVEATDPDIGDVLTYSLTTSPAGMTIDSGTGLIQWTPTNEQIGDNDVVVQVADAAVAKDTQSFSITVSEAAAPTMHVDSIAVSYVDLGKGQKQGHAEVIIVDNNGSVVVGATVIGTFTEDIAETVTATTDSYGVAVLETTETKKGRCHLTFCVDVDGVHDTLTYKPEDNVESCDSNY